MKQWLIRHPRTLGALFVVLAFFAFREGIDDAKMQRRFADAKPVRVDVVSVTKHSSFPPRWRAEMTSRQRGAAGPVVIVGTGKGWSDPAVSPGQTLDILVAADGRDPAILASRQKSSILRLGPLEFDATEFWLGIAFAIAGLCCFVFAGRIEREAKELFDS
jgi:hypothetical protein